MTDAFRRSRAGFVIMKQIVFAFALTAAACAATGCAQFEQALSLVGPDGTVNLSSLAGTWYSAGSVGAGPTTCTNFQWKLNGQEGLGVRGEFTATCGSMPAAGTVTAQLNGHEIPFQIQGSGTVAGQACAVSMTGTGRMEGSDTIRIPFSGTTCQGPAFGEEILRRTTPPAAQPPPSQTPPPGLPPQPPGSSFHIGAGPLTAVRAERVVNATADEFENLRTPRGSESESIDAAEELLRRVIWHLQLAGYQAGRQRNPSGAISNDKLTVYADGYWRSFDLFRDLGRAGQYLDVIFLEVFPADHMPEGGIPD